MSSKKFYAFKDFSIRANTEELSKKCTAHLGGGGVLDLA